MDSDKNYQESKVKGSGKGFVAAWGPTILGFAVGGPGGAVLGAAAGELISRKINTGKWNGAYEN